MQKPRFIERICYTAAMQAHSYFISDLHLCAAYPDITQGFFQFLSHEASQAQALYILGDFFELWVGDDHTTPFNTSIINALRDLSQQGVKIYFMPGNRDFLLGQRFLRAAGVHALPDPSVISLYGNTLLLTHGDGLCTLDYAHQRFRRLYLNKTLQRIVLCFSLRLRLWVGRKIRKKSRHQQIKAYDNPRFDVTEIGINTLVNQYPCQYMIHGHTHKPAIHEHVINDQTLQRVVLGAWDDEAQILRASADGRLTMVTLPLVNNTAQNA